MDDARILVIHNNDEVVSHNTINLVSLGHKVHSVDDESMGLRLLAADPDGWSLLILKQRQSSPTHNQNIIDAARRASPGTPIVLVSSLSQNLARDIYEDVAAIVEWPYDARQLALVVHDVLSEGKRTAS